MTRVISLYTNLQATKPKHPRIRGDNIIAENSLTHAIAHPRPETFPGNILWGTASTKMFPVEPPNPKCFTGNLLARKGSTGNLPAGECSTRNLLAGECSTGNLPAGECSTRNLLAGECSTRNLLAGECSTGTF